MSPRRRSELFRLAIGLIAVASTASREFRFKEALLSGLLLAALSVGVFVIGLKLQLPIWPGSG